VPCSRSILLTAAVALVSLPACSGSDAPEPASDGSSVSVDRESETTPAPTIRVDTVPTMPDVTAPPLAAGSPDNPFPPLPDDGVTRALRTPTGVVLPVVGETRDGDYLALDPCGARVLVGEDVEPISRAHVVLDAGHGGHDPGAVGRGGTTEADVNLAVAESVAERLAAEGAEVVLSRTGDHTMNLETRVRLVNGLGPTVFLSVHHNGGSPAGGPTPTPMVIHQHTSPESKTLATALVGQLEASFEVVLAERELERGIRAVRAGAWATERLAQAAVEAEANATRLVDSIGGTASTPPSQGSAELASVRQTTPPSTTAPGEVVGSAPATAAPAPSAPVTGAPAPPATPAPAAPTTQSAAQVTAELARSILPDVAASAADAETQARRAELWAADARGQLEAGIANAPDASPAPGDPEAPPAPTPGDQVATELASMDASVARATNAAAQARSLADAVALAAGQPNPTPGLPSDDRLLPSAEGLTPALELPPELEPLEPRTFFGARTGGPRSFTRSGDIDTLYLLRQAPNVPSVLTEAMFLSNPDEEELLSRPAFLERQADALARTLVAYVGDPATPPGRVDTDTAIRARGDAGCLSPDLGVEVTRVQQRTPTIGSERSAGRSTPDDR